MKKKIFALALLSFTVFIALTPSALAESVPAPVHVLVIVDDDALLFFAAMPNKPVGDVFLWACYILEAGSEPFWTNFQIDFVPSVIRFWQSPQTNNLNDLLAYAIVTFPMPTDIEIRYVLTGQCFYLIGGLASPAANSFIITTYAPPIERLWQHEASHLYHVGDHAVTDLTPCIINYWYPWYPAWCSGCWNTIYSNCFHFGFSFPIRPHAFPSEPSFPEDVVNPEA